MSGFEVVSQFTDDARADMDMVCKRQSCGTLIHKGAPCFYVAAGSGQGGKYVCEACFNYYLQKPSTITRARGTTTSLPDPVTIRQSVNAAQRRSSINPPPVATMPRSVVPLYPSSSTSGAGRPFLPSTQQFQGPDVQVPSAWRNPPQPVNPHFQVGASTRTQALQAPSPIPPHSQAVPPPSPIIGAGYAAEHARYASERDRWARLSFCPPPAETISLDFTALYDGGPRRSRLRGTQIGASILFFSTSYFYYRWSRANFCLQNICEGKRDIDARITTPELVKLALTTIVPCLKDHCPRFQWREDEFVVRDSQWVDLSKHADPFAPYFFKDCLQPSTRKNSKALVFKSKQFSLYVVIPEPQWLEYQDFIEKMDEDAASPTLGSEPLTAPKSGQPLEAAYACARVKDATPAAIPTVGPGLAPSIKPLEVMHTRAWDRTVPLFLRSGDTSSRVPDALLTSTSESFPGDPATSTCPLSFDVNGSAVRLHPSSPSRTPHPSKHGHERISSTSSATAMPPPLKKNSTADAGSSSSSALCSPDRNKLKGALQTGGSADVDVTKLLKVKIEPIEFYPIPTRPLMEILNGDPDDLAFSIETMEPVAGHIRIDTSTDGIVGVGSFKTAHLAQLTLTPPPPAGLGSEPRHAVIMKRPYIKKGQLPGPPYTRLGIKDELEKLFREANVLYWAKALMTMTYGFIDRALAKATVPPPFEIPQLHFVDAGLVIAFSQVANGLKKSKAGTVSAAYLVEEDIQCSDDDFIKYIHNGDCVPLPEPGEPGHDISQFLVFTQHVQYSKTGGQVYVSDYQGSALLLTDPQILMHPSVGEGRNLFGDGNLEIGVRLFEKEHACNKFCKWLGFGLEGFGDKDDTKEDD
ncbi:hypothetical protein BU15DRAFT_67057 [Melanogaster broomeanus]|nr:hypothetical protein BU15DRAFT_67057 [Melanogaster broomeanus]